LRAWTDAKADDRKTTFFPVKRGKCKKMGLRSSKTGNRVGVNPGGWPVTKSIRSPILVFSRGNAANASDPLVLIGSYRSVPCVAPETRPPYPAVFSSSSIRRLCAPGSPIVTDREDARRVPANRQRLVRGPVGSDVIDRPQDSGISSARATAARVTLFFFWRISAAAAASPPYSRDPRLHLFDSLGNCLSNRGVEINIR